MRKEVRKKVPDKKKKIEQRRGEKVGSEQKREGPQREGDSGEREKRRLSGDVGHAALL